jgi:hypothetical protein
MEEANTGVMVVAVVGGFIGTSAAMAICTSLLVKTSK